MTQRMATERNQMIHESKPLFDVIGWHGGTLFSFHDQLAADQYAFLIRRMGGQAQVQNNPYKWMKQQLQVNPREYQDSAWEWQATKLAEDCAVQFNLHVGDNCDIPEWVFDMAVDAIDAYIEVEHKESFLDNEQQED